MKNVSKLFNKMAGRLPASPLVAGTVANQQMGKGIDMKSAMFKALSFNPQTMSRRMPSPQKMGAMARELGALEASKNLKM